MTNLITRFCHSSIGKKWIVAFTGLVLIAYVIGHMIGNLQIFIGRDRLNSYAVMLHSMGPLLWAIRAFLLAAFVVHILTTIQLTVENRAARPARYAVKEDRQAGSASKTMIVSGLIVLCFVVYHLLQFTTETVNPEFRTLVDSQGRHDVYAMVILGFSNPYVASFYILGLFLLCLHLSHGFQSFLQTIGANSKKVAPALDMGSRVLAWVIFVGYTSIPVAVWLGLLHASP